MLELTKVEGKDGDMLRTLCGKVKEISKSAVSNNAEFEWQMSALQKANEKFEVAAKRDGELVKNISETIDKLRGQVEELETKLAKSTRELQQLKQDSGSEGRSSLKVGGGQQPGLRQLGSEEIML